MALNGSAQVSKHLQAFDRTMAFCTEALALFGTLGDVVMRANTLRSLCNSVDRLGDRARAWALVEEALSLSRELSDTRGQGDAYQLLGMLALREDDLVRAISLLRSAIMVLHESGDRYLIIWSCFRLAQTRARQGDLLVGDRVASPVTSSGARAPFQDAVRLLSAVAALRLQHQLSPIPQMDLEYDRALPILRQHLGAPSFERAWGEGQTMSFEPLVEYALEIARDAAPASPTKAGEASTTPPDPDLALLTPREREIATLVARGLANRQIAVELVVSERTAETHVHNILGKLELTSRGQLAFWAVEHGLMSSNAQ